jgi:hypothetical protein
MLISILKGSQKKAMDFNGLVGCKEGNEKVFRVTLVEVVVFPLFVGSCFLVKSEGVK